MRWQQCFWWYSCKNPIDLRSHSSNTCSRGKDWWTEELFHHVISCVNFYINILWSCNYASRVMAWTSHGLWTISLVREGDALLTLEFDVFLYTWWHHLAISLADVGHICWTTLCVFVNLCPFLFCFLYNSSSLLHLLRFYALLITMPNILIARLIPCSVFFLVFLSTERS